MKNIKTIAIVAVFATLSLSACKKRYPEGPAISFRSPMHRLIGEWHITGFYINGNNATDSLNKIDFIAFISAKANYRASGDANNKYSIYFKSSPDSTSWNQSFSFSNHNKELNMDSYFGNYYSYLLSYP